MAKKDEYVCQTCGYSYEISEFAKSASYLNKLTGRLPYCKSCCSEFYDRMLMEQQDEMSFWDHLEELRWTLFRIIVALFIFAIAGFSVMPWLFDNVVTAPCYSDFIT